MATNVFEQQEEEDQQDQQLGPKRGYNHLPLRADGLLDNGVVWRGPASVGDLNLLSGQLLLLISHVAASGGDAED